MKDETRSRKALSLCLFLSFASSFFLALVTWPCFIPNVKTIFSKKKLNIYRLKTIQVSDCSGIQYFRCQIYRNSFLRKSVNIVSNFGHISVSIIPVFYLWFSFTLRVGLCVGTIQSTFFCESIYFVLYYQEIYRMNVSFSVFQKTDPQFLLFLFFNQGVLL